MKDAKTHKEFRLEVVNIDDDLMYNCLLSHHMVPFKILSPADAFLPVIKDEKEIFVLLMKKHCF